MQRNDPTDWEAVWTSAKGGAIEAIPADVRIRCYNQL